MTAYFSYNNVTGRDLTVTNSTSQGTINTVRLDGAVTSDQPPTTFKVGQSKGTVIMRFSGGSATWVVKASGSRLSEARASDQSPECPRVVPLAECRGFEQGFLTVKLGYENKAEFEQLLPVGKSNGFSPGSADRGQPNRFFPGLNRAAFEVPFANPNDTFTWNINQEKVVISSSLAVCVGRCIDVPVGTIKGDLDQIAIDLSALMNKAAAVLVSVKDKAPVKSKADIQRQRSRSRLDAVRSNKKAAEYERIAKALVIQYPSVVKVCPEAPQFCVAVDRQGTIDALRGLYANQRNSVVRVMARVLFRSTGNTSRRQKLVKEARALEQKGLDQLGKLPRFATECK